MSIKPFSIFTDLMKIDMLQFIIITSFILAILVAFTIPAYSTFQNQGGWGVFFGNGVNPNPPPTIQCPEGQHLSGGVCVDDNPPPTLQYFTITGYNNAFNFRLNQTTVTVCASLCDYPKTQTGLINAINFITNNPSGGKVEITGTIDTYYPTELKSNVWLAFQPNAKIIHHVNASQTLSNKGVLNGNGVFNVYISNANITTTVGTIKGMNFIGNSNHIVINGSSTFVKNVKGNNSANINCVDCRYFSLDDGTYQTASRNFNIGRFQAPTELCRYIYVANAEAFNSAIEGIKVNGCKDVLITGNNAHNNANNNIDVGFTLRANVTFNTASTTSHSNIHLDKANTPRILNNSFSSSTLDSIAVCGTLYSLVQGNTIEDNAKNGISVTNCSQTPSNNTINQNHINNSRDGIYISSIAQFTTVTHNRGHLNTGTLVIDNSSTTTKFDNLVI